ncbi:mucin-5AC-like [Daphnia carinata]|uniref:mucin-5AC-like n=1 Tax=Daphnia carinata TaxID=120202 RepID=UPI00257F477B|nr:mucin-5AC-like [Daphnia carinata]
MWNNSVLMDGVKWSFDRSSPPLTDGTHPDFSLEETQFRSWHFEAHQQTNYSDWTNRLHPGEEDEDAEDLFVRHDPADCSRRNYPSAAELFRNFVGDEGADRMEFYINHLTMEGCDANNISAALMADAETTAVEESAPDVAYRPPFPLLDTIVEETLEELLLDMSDSSPSPPLAADESSESPSSNSGRWGWGWGWLNTSDDDSSSVIHVPVGDAGSSAAITSGSLVRHSELTDVNSGIYRADGLDDDFDLGNDDDDFEENDGEGSERDQEVPKKKRRISCAMDEDDRESAPSRSPSVTDSLIQFEALEKELDSTEESFAEESTAVVFRTSATTLPFEDADDGIMSPELDPEVFLDCHEHLESPASATQNGRTRQVATPSANFFNFLDDFQDPSISQEFYTTCGWFSPPARSWSSMPSLHWNAEEKTEMRSSRSACDVSKCDSVTGIGASGCVEQTYEGRRAALRPTHPWGITFDPSQEIDEEGAVEDEDDDQVNDNDDDHWEPDGFLNSDIEEYDTGSNSDDDEYSTERCDRFDEFGLGFISGRSQRMRSFRSYGDSLNLLDTADDPVTHSTSSSSSSSSSSSCSPDRSSPEEDLRHPSSSRSRHSVEALSEDSGYGDASGSLPLMQQQQSKPDNNKRAIASIEEVRMADASTPPAKCLHALELPNSLSLTICLPDGSPPSCSHDDCQWPPEVERATREKEDDAYGEGWDEEEEEKADEWRGQSEVKDKTTMALSALLLRRQPRCRPTPLTLKEAEEFLIDDGSPEVVNDGESRCGVSGICIDLESKMSHTSNGNVAATAAATTTNDDILHRPGTDLEASKFNPQIGSSGWEVPDGMGEAVKAAAHHQHSQAADEEEEKEQQQHSLHSADGSDFIRPPDASKHQNCSDLGHNVTCPQSIPSAMDSAFYPAPVVLKRYGPRQEVEVYISQQQLPVGAEAADPAVSTPTANVSSTSIRGVHFSPVVSAVNWRESYLNQSEDDCDDNTSNGSSAAEANRIPEDEEKENNCDAPESAVKVGQSEQSPSMVEKVKLVPDSPIDGVAAVEPIACGIQDSGRNGSSNSCTTTSNSATTATTPTTTTSHTGTTTTTTSSNSKKPPLFQRFSLSRLSARMSATFSRSESKRESGKKAIVSDGAIPTESKDAPTETTAPVAKGNGKKNKNKQQTDASAEVKPTSKKIDDFKVVKEPKKRFFSRPFQRSSSTPPMSSSGTPETGVQTRATLTPVSPSAAVASGKESSSSDATLASNVSCRPTEKSQSHQESVAKQPITTSSNDENTPPKSESIGAAIEASRTSVVTSISPSACAGSGPPIPSPRNKVHAKPPLPPQTKPRTIHARKNYLVPVEPAPPVPMVSSAGLQHALQHFKETARMERERLANSVPDLAAPPTPTPRPTSDCIDPRGNEMMASSAPAPSRPTTTATTVYPGSRERARQAVLSRASSVETAWNATASRAVLNLSRRNIACSTQEFVGAGGISTQGHGPTKSRPVVPGLLETNLDSVVPSSSSSQQQRHPQSYSNRNGSPSDETNLDELIQNLQLFCNSKRVVEYSPQPLSVDSGSATATTTDKRFKSMLNLGSSSAPVSVQPDIDMMTDPTSSSVRVPDTNRAKSMEFLLDEDNKSAVQVPENQLKKCGERKMSEHELRIQRSLQKLNVPEWYKNNARSGSSGDATSGAALNSATNNNGTDGSNSGTTTGVLRRRDYHGGSVCLRNGGWTGLSSANREAGTASSMTSLGSALSRSGTPTRVVIPTRVRPDWRSIKSSRESLTSPAETCHATSWNGPASLSSNQQSFSRWGSGRSSYSTCPSPAPSASSSASSYRTSLLNQHGRAPYLGWRSQERLNASPAPLSLYQSPAQRLASSLLTKTSCNDVSDAGENRVEVEPTAEGEQRQQHETDEVVRSSIRQVTSAIVHYVSESSDGDQPPSPASRNGLSRSPERHPLEALSRSPSPRRQRCLWVESSFVGGGASPTSHQRPVDPAPAVSPLRPESPPSSSSGSSHHLHRHRSTGTTANNGRPGLSDRTVAGPLSAAERDDGGTSPQLGISPPVSATLDDVLNSLLGLTPPQRHGLLRRPVSQPTIHNKQAHHQQQQDGQQHGQQQPYQSQHQQQMRGNNNNNSMAIHEAASRSFNDLRSSTTSTSIK